MTDPSHPGRVPLTADPPPVRQPASDQSKAQPPRCPTRTRLYLHGEVIAEGFPAEDISEQLAGHPDSIVWLDLFDPNAADLRIVTDEFGLHPLAVEDAIHDHQRPKLDRYGTHMFMNMYAVSVDIDEQNAELTTTELSAFIVANALITVRKAACDIEPLIARWSMDAELAADGGVGFFVYGLLDAVIDGHYEVVQQLDDAIDVLEDQLFQSRPEIDIRRRGFGLRKTLAELRRVVAPMREVVGQLMRGDTHVVHPNLLPYYQDVYDHVLRAGERVDSGRDRVAGVLDADSTEQGNRLNEITKKLAAWAAIIAVPTAVTGFYGQNVPYPGFSQHWGFVVSVAVMIVLAGGLYVLLKRRNWL